MADEMKNMQNEIDSKVEEAIREEIEKAEETKEEETKTEEREEPTIVVNAKPTNQYIQKITTDNEVFDYYDKQDFSQKNFLFLPPGTSEIFFDPGVREEARCEIEFCEEYIAH